MEDKFEHKTENDDSRPKEIAEEIKEKIEKGSIDKRSNGRKMRFWEIHIAKEPPKLRGEEIELDKLMNYIFGYGESYADKWDSTLELYIEEGSIDDSDVFRFSNALFVINKKTKEIFDLLAKEDVEYLDLICKDGNLVIANLITIIDCINMETSKYKVYKGNKDCIQFFDKLYFKDGVIRDVNLFIARHLENNVFIRSELFKETIERNNIRGFCFKYLAECEI